MESVKRVANFIIINVRSLEAGLLAKVSFDELGGIIGSGSEANWYLKDQNQLIQPIHCEIDFIDGSFCVKDVSGETFMNSSNMPLGKNNYARLVNEDEIKIGDYEIRVFVDRDAELKMNGHSLEQLFINDATELLDDAPTALEGENIEIDYTELSNLDPIFALDSYDVEPIEESLLEDIIEDDFDESEKDLLNHINENRPNLPLKFTMQADSDNDISSAVGLNDIRKKSFFPQKGRPKELIEKLQSRSTFDNEKTNVKQAIEVHPMDDNVLDLLEQEVAKTYSKEDRAVSSSGDNGSLIDNYPTENNYVFGDPMLEGLGVNIGNNANLEQMQSLSVEIGSTLRACIQGVLDLHMQVKDTRYGMMHRSLQPIEDNPLRLGLSYEDTIRTMFDENKSAVHLSAKSSVEESLKMIKIHNEAVQYATNLALGQILSALSPDALLKRFSRYNRDEKPNSDQKSWAWGMYENYYKELTSNRQQGFEKLFWEIFEQAYDQKLREKHAE